MSKGKKIFLTVLAVLLLLCVLIITTACILSSMLLDKRPFVKNLTPPSPELVASAFSKISTSMAEGSSSEKDSSNTSGNPLGSLMNLAMDVPAELILDANEVNAIFYGMISNDDGFGQSSGIPAAGDTPIKELTKLELKDGEIYIEYPLKLKFNTPFGSYINLQCEVIPEIKNNRLFVKVVNFKAGSFSISGKHLQEKVDSAVIVAEKDKQLQQVLDIVQELKVTNDSAIIRYSRAKLAVLLLQYANINTMTK